MTTRVPPAAFEMYVECRSYREVAERLGVSKRAITKHAQKEKWQTRIQEIDREVRTRSDKKAIETLEAMNERHLKSLRVIQGKALQALGAMSLRTAMEAVRALDLAIKNERTIRGEPADRTALSVEDTIRAEYDKWLVADAD